MAQATVKVKRLGDSLGVIIPAKIAREERLQPGDIVSMDIARPSTPRGFGMARGARPLQRKAEGHEDAL